MDFINLFFRPCKFFREWDEEIGPSSKSVMIWGFICFFFTFLTPAFFAFLRVSNKGFDHLFLMVKEVTLLSIDLFLNYFPHLVGILILLVFGLFLALRLMGEKEITLKNVLTLVFVLMQPNVYMFVYIPIFVINIKLPQIYFYFSGPFFIISFIHRYILFHCYLSKKHKTPLFKIIFLYIVQLIIIIAPIIILGRN